MSNLSNFLNNTNSMSGYKNKIINGCFRVKQRDDSNTSHHYLDRFRWRANSFTGGTTTQAQGTSVLSSNEYVNTIVGYFDSHTANCYISHKIENVETLNNKFVTMSFWIKPSVQTYVNTQIYQHFGNILPRSEDVSNVSSQKLVSANVWTKIKFTCFLGSISGKILSTNNTDSIIIQLGISSDGSTGPMPDSSSVEFAQLQLEEGTHASDFEQRPIQLEEELCFRYYD